MKTNLIFLYLSPIPICPRLYHVLWKRFFHKILKLQIVVQISRENIPSLKLSKIGPFMIIRHKYKTLSWFLNREIPWYFPSSYSYISGGWVWGIFQIHSKDLYKHPNESRNHLEWLFWLCETCLRYIRNHPTTKNYFLRLHFRKLPPENE